MTDHASNLGSRWTSRPLHSHRRAALAAALTCFALAAYLALSQSDHSRLRSASELGSRQRYVQSLAEARRVSRAPAASRALLVRAQAAQALGRHREAIGLFRRVAERSPRTWFVHRDWAISLLALGRRRAARQRLEVASALNPRLEPPPGF